MAFGKQIVTRAGAEVILHEGIAAIVTTEMVNLVPQDYTRKGVVLVSERKSVVVTEDDPDRPGHPIEVQYDLSLSIIRGARTEAEARKVTETASGMDAAKRLREQQEAEALAREKREMFKLGAEAGEDKALAMVAARNRRDALV